MSYVKEIMEAFNTKQVIVLIGLILLVGGAVGANYMDNKLNQKDISYMQRDIAEIKDIVKDIQSELKSKKK